MTDHDPRTIVKGILTNRQCELVRAAMEDLKNGRHAPSHELLVEHDVTMDEALTLLENLALGAAMLLEVVRETGSSLALERDVGMDRFARAIMAD